jgi:hypothetical protein
MGVQRKVRFFEIRLLITATAADRTRAEAILLEAVRMHAVEARPLQAPGVSRRPLQGASRAAEREWLERS